MAALWALHQMGALDDRTAQAAFAHSHPATRMWAVRFLGDKHGVNRGLGAPGAGGGAPARELPDGVFRALLELARRETSAEVRAQISSTARRLPTTQALAAVAALASHDEDVADPYLPLLNWWVLEAHVTLDRESVLAMFQDSGLWEHPMAQQHLLPRLMRRFAAEGRRQDLATCARLLRMAPGDAHRAFLLKGFEEAYRGRPMIELFFKGGRIGPDLTSYQRDNLGTMLLSIINPNAEIREGFEYHQVETKDGRSLSGFLVERDLQIVVLRGLEGEDVTLRQSELKALRPVGRSLMPEGLLEGLDARQLRDLFAYLRISQPITR